MQGVRLVTCFVCTILILIFAIIHLGVSIGIIGRLHSYGDIFRPEIGLAAFNIVISLYALLIGGFGLFAVVTDRGNLSTVVGFASILLALFTLVSLIAALSINSLAINYVNSHFLNYMNSYVSSQNSRNIIDKVQTKYDCCGSSTWLDWTHESLNATGSSTSGTTTAATSTGAVNVTSTTASTANGTNNTATRTTVGTNSTAATVVSSTSTTALTIVGSTSTATGTVSRGTTVTRAINTSVTDSVVKNVRRFRNTVESAIFGSDAVLQLFNSIMGTADTHFLPWEEDTEKFNHERNSAQQTIRRRRQTQSNYGGIYGLPLSFSVTLPQSCCTSDLSSTDSLSNLYCISNNNNATANIHTDGCTRQLGKLAVGQTLGLSVINSFLFLLSLAVIFFLIEKNPGEHTPQSGFTNQPAQYYQPQFGGYSAPHYNPGMAYNTHNPSYAGYY